MEQQEDFTTLTWTATRHTVEFPVEMAKGREKEVTVSWHWDTEGLQHGVFWDLHDANAAVYLALSVVVVGVGVGIGIVPRASRRRRATGIWRAAMLVEDVDTFLTSCSPGKEEWRLTAGIAALHVHTVLYTGWNQRIYIRNRKTIIQSKNLLQQLEKKKLWTPKCMLAYLIQQCVKYPHVAFSLLNWIIKEPWTLINLNVNNLALCFGNSSASWSTFNYYIVGLKCYLLFFFFS